MAFAKQHLDTADDDGPERRLPPRLGRSTRSPAHRGSYTAGDARSYGSASSYNLYKPVVSVAATQAGKGYWKAGGDGGVFSFGDAAFLGSMGGKPLNAPVVGMAAT